ncbi:MAG: hypothetical protein FWF92_02540 [Oscillospiraceae bacterium]|nr:hypothetical protein [Oscillospiraceae bacterium]
MLLDTGFQKEKEKYPTKKHSDNYNYKNKKSDITDVREIFRQTTHINMQINAKIEEISYWRHLASKAQQVFSEVNTRGARKSTSRVEECVCKIIDIEESLKTDMDDLIALKEKAMRIIDKMDVPEYKSLLIHRYICDKTWYEVADSMGYSYVHIVNRLHPKALKRISEIAIGAEN